MSEADCKELENFERYLELVDQGVSEKDAHAQVYGQVVKGHGLTVTRYKTGEIKIQGDDDAAVRAATERVREATEHGLDVLAADDPLRGVLAEIEAQAPPLFSPSGTKRPRALN